MAKKEKAAKPRSSTAEHIVWWPIERLHPDPRNSRRHPPGQIYQLRQSFQTYGWVWPILATGDGEIIAGEGRWLAAKEEGFTQAKVLVADGMTEQQRQAFIIADNRLPLDAEWDDDILRQEMEALRAADFNLEAIGFGQEELDRIFAAEIAKAASERGTLADAFGLPPFSVLNAREGWWQDRKRAWISLGIQSELGRGQNLIQRSPQEVFTHATGIPYDKARKIVTRAIEAEGEAFDLQALIRKHGRRAGRTTVNAVPGGGNKMPLDRPRRAVPGNPSASAKAAMPLDRKRAGI